MPGPLERSASPQPPAPQAILAHNLKAAATWGSGGPRYDRISRSIADIEGDVEARLGRVGLGALDEVGV